MPRLRRRIPRRILQLILLVVGLPLAVIASIVGSTAPYRHNEATRVPKRDAAIIFGAYVTPNGVLSPMLRDRMNGGIELYQKGTVSRLLLTGDNSSATYDEVDAMKAYALEHQVPASAITLDYAGFSTYESCYRAQAVFKLQNAVLVTQRYHLPRAVYSCRKLGIDAAGYGVPDFSLYPGTTLRYSLREMGADLKAWWQLNITHPLPTFLGSSEQTP